MSKAPGRFVSSSFASVAALLLVAAPAFGARAPHVDVSQAKSCDFLVGQSVCVAPFPNDYFTAADKATATGRRVAFAKDSMPANTKGKHIDPTDWNRSDGFSPGGAIIVRVPGMDNPAAFKRSKIVPITDMARAYDKRQAVVVIDAATGKRSLIWAELDSQAATDGERNLLIHPGKNFLEGHRYIVALRTMRNAAGKVLSAPPAFRIYRDGLRSSQRVVERRRPHMEAVLRTLAKAGIGRKSLYLAWDFTVASAKNIAGRALAIRNDAFKTLGDTTMGDGIPQGHAPSYKITTVTDFAPCVAGSCTAGQDPDMLRQIQGTFDVPCYLNQPQCVTGSTFTLDAKGLPVRTPGNVMAANFVCNIPRVAYDGITPAHKLLPALYGHGLFGSFHEARGSRNVHQLGNENGVLVCATDFSGMADEDEATAIPILQDLSGFPQLADRMQQGLLNFMFLARLLDRPDGFAADPNFMFGGTSVVDTSSVAYYGNSQGGILGGSLTALSPDVTRSVLYVPGMTYSTLVIRSVDFDDPDTTADFAGVLELGYPKDVENPLVLGLVQMLWDRGEPDGYAEHMTSNPLPQTPKHHVLIDMSFGDHQVANVTAETEARTIGAKARRPVLDPGRSPDRTPQYGIPALGKLPRDDNGFVVWDIGPIRQQDGASFGTNAPPTANIPPSLGQDPHDYVIEHSPALRRQIADYMRPGGKITDVCAGKPCRTPDWAGP